MRRLIILAIVLILVLSLSSVSAGLFGPDVVESDQFSFKCPEGFHKVDDTVLPSSASAVTGFHAGETSIGIKVVELNSSGFLPSNMEIFDEFTEGDLKVIKGHSTTYGNCTCAEFDKDGRHFLIAVDYLYGDVEMSEAVKLIKEVKDSIELKDVPELNYYNETNFLP